MSVNTKNKIDLGKTKILKYLNEDCLENGYLKNLDEPGKSYTGVTISYLQHYIVPDLKLWEIGEVLIEFLEEDKINGLYCNDVKNFVFNSFHFKKYNSFAKSRSRNYWKSILHNEINGIKIPYDDLAGLKSLISILKEDENKYKELWNYTK